MEQVNAWLSPHRSLCVTAPRAEPVWTTGPEVDTAPGRCSLVSGSTKSLHVCEETLPGTLKVSWVQPAGANELGRICVDECVLILVDYDGKLSVQFDAALPFAFGGRTLNPQMPSTARTAEGRYLPGLAKWN